MSRHRSEEVRPRWGRILLVGVASIVTAVALIGGVVQGDDAPVVAVDRAPVTAAADGPPTPDVVDAAAPAAVSDAASGQVLASTTLHRDKSLPTDSGAGYRVVFSQSRQRVWLVSDDGATERTYLVSGSVYDNLDPGSYAVYSRSMNAIGVDDSGTMRYFVRFTQGDNAAIGFHDIPINEGAPVQTTDQLGTPLSHGCIRQRERDAVALWAFAPVGTPVVVTA